MATWIPLPDSCRWTAGNDTVKLLLREGAGRYLASLILYAKVLPLAQTDWFEAPTVEVAQRVALGWARAKLAALAEALA